MAKGFKGRLRRTGRRTGFKSRVNRFRGTNSRASTAFAIPRQLYLPVPAQFYASVRLTSSSIEEPGVAGVFQEIQSMLEPYRTIAAVVNFAEYWRPLMRIYSRCFVAKCQVTYQFQNALGQPLEAVLGIIPNGTAVLVPGGAAGVDQLCSYPENRHTIISPAEGGHSYVTLSVLYDAEKFLNQGVERDVCVNSDVNGGIVVPPMVATAQSPVSIVHMFNRGPAVASCIVRRTWTYHVMFMDRHAQSQTEAI